MLHQAIPLIGRGVLAGVIAITLALWVQPSEWWHRPWTDAYVGSPGTAETARPATYFLVERPLAFVIRYLPAASRFYQLADHDLPILPGTPYQITLDREHDHPDHQGGDGTCGGGLRRRRGLPTSRLTGVRSTRPTVSPCALPCTIRCGCAFLSISRREAMMTTKNDCAWFGRRAVRVADGCRRAT